MAYGLSITNESGELVVDSDAGGMHYIGQASYLTDVQHTNTTFVRERCERRYSITMPSTTAIPLVAFMPTTDRWIGVRRVTRSSGGSAVWYIDLYSADSTQLAVNFTDFSTSASVDVHVFSSEPGTGSSYGLRLYNSAGNLSWDFGAKPIFIRQVLDFPVRTDHATYQGGDSLAFVGGLTTPWIIGASPHGKDNNRIGAVGSHEDSEYVWQTDGSGNLKRLRLVTYYERGETGGSPYSPQPDFELPAKTIFVVDGANY